MRNTVNMHRELVAIGIGIACLIAAAGVSAQAGDQKLTVDDIPRMMSQGKSYTDRMQKMVSDGFTELEEARKQQNVGRVNCVNDALTAIKGLLRLAEGNYLGMQEAAARKDPDGVEHEFVKVSIAFNKTEELNGQLQGCGGPDTGSAIDGRPYIQKEIDPDLPSVDPTSGLSDIKASLETPPSMSPFFQNDNGN